MSFDAPGATYTHRQGKCSFETLVEEYRIDEPAIALMAKVVHGADIADDRDATPESRGLLAIADGFALLEVDEQRQLELDCQCTTPFTPGHRHRFTKRHRDEL